MKLLIKFIKIATTANLLIIVPLVVFTLITSRTPALNGIQSFVVLTGSMQPTIPQGSLIYTIPQASYAKGDIVAFKSGNVNVTHRITEVLNTSGTATYKTKGDANNAADTEKLLSNEIIGRQIFFIPYAGKAVALIQTPFGFFYVVLFPIIAFVIIEIWNLKKEIEKEAERKFREKMKFANEHSNLFTNKQIA